MGRDIFLGRPGKDASHVPVRESDWGHHQYWVVWVGPIIQEDDRAQKPERQCGSRKNIRWVLKAKIGDFKNVGATPGVKKKGDR